ASVTGGRCGPCFSLTRRARAATVKHMGATSRAAWIVRIPTPLWLLGLIIVALLVDLSLESQPILRHRPTGIALLIAGLALSASARLTFKRHRAEIYPWSEAHSALVTDGPFRFSRNPMYLGLIIVGVGAALIAGTWAMWLVPAAVFLLDHLVIVPFEER